MKQVLKIYYTSDVHGYFYPTTYGDMIRKNMGLLACASEYEKDENTLVIDGGDMLQGSAFAYYCHQNKNSSKLMADVVNACGYDYCTIGNHDFNYGLDYQKEYLENLNAKCVCQNICDENDNPLYPYEIKVMPNGLKLGIVGIVTDYINVWEKKENIAGVHVNDPFEAAKRALEELKGKVDFTIGIYHGGFESDLDSGKLLSDTTENVGYKICKELDFDLLLTGHQHLSVDGRYLHGTYVVQPLNMAREYHCIKISKSEDKFEITSDKITPDASNMNEKIYNEFLSLENDIQSWLNIPVGHLSKALLPEDRVQMALNGSPIADFINKVQLYFTDAQVSVVGLANEIAGFRQEVSSRDIIATYPFPNTLVVLKITGAKLKASMEHSAEYFDYDAEGKLVVADSFVNPKLEHYNYDYFAGVDYTIDPSKPLGSRIVKLEYQGKAVEPEDEFTLALNNYRATGAGGYPMYKGCKVVKEVNIEMVELLMEYFRKHDYIEV